MRARRGGARLRYCMAPRIWCGLFAWCVGVGALVVGSLRLRASSPLPPLTRSPLGDGFWLLHMLYGVAQKGWLFLGLLLCSCWGGGGCFSFLIFAVIQKNPTSKEVGFLILDFSIYILSFTCNCSGNYLVNATPTYWPAPFWRAVTVKPRASPTKRTGT